MENCLFCKIIDNQLPSQKVLENKNVLVFKDIYPQAKIHYIFVHKKHSKDIVDMSREPNQLLELFNAINEVASKENLEKIGFRLVNNCGAAAGQTVFHTHFHLLSGEPLKGFGA